MSSAFRFPASLALMSLLGAASLLAQSPVAPLPAARVRTSPHETISTVVADTVRPAVDFRRAPTGFYARGEAAWQEYLRTGVSHPVDEVLDRTQARIDARRRQL